MADYTISNLDLSGNVTVESINNTGRFHTSKGSNITSTLYLTLGTGNYFVVSGGTATIRAINKEDWQSGDIITIRFADAGVTLEHNNAFDPNNYGLWFQLENNVTTTQNMTLSFVFDDDALLWFCTATI